MVAFKRQLSPAGSAPSRAGLEARGLTVLDGKAERSKVDARGAPRVRTAVPLWLCGDEGSARGWALELSATGARVGGVGACLAPGTRVVVKLAVAAGEAAVVLRAEVVRYAPVLAHDGAACPELCLRFLDGAAAGLAQALERARLEALLEQRLEDHRPAQVS